jgi:uncharacterized protein YkwD
MKCLKRIVAFFTAAVLVFGISGDATAEVLPDGTYSKGNQWYFSEDTEFDYTGILRYDESGNPIGSTAEYSFSEESPAAMYQEGVTDYSLTVYQYEISFPLTCKIGLKGDINNDGRRDVFDAVAIAKFSVGSYEPSGDFYAFLGDVNKSGVLDVFDAVTLAKIVNDEEQAAAIAKKKEHMAILEKVVELVNVERVNAGVDPVVLDTKLCEAADVRAKEISTYWSHNRPDGSSCFTVLDNMKIDFVKAGENIAVGYESAEDVVEGWMSSPGHRANMLDSDYTKIGVGYYYDSGSEYIYHWSQFFTD